MKKILFIIMAVGVCGVAHATIKCLPFGKNTKFIYVGSGTNAGIWNAKYTLNGQTMWVGGDIACASKSGTLGDAIVLQPPYGTISSDPEQNVHCWCRMIGSYTSSWVFAETYASFANCAASCNGACSSKLVNSAEFRAAMFPDL